MRPCPYMAMAVEDPDRLLAMLDDLPLGDLTIAAEAAGWIDTEQAAAKLISLLRHESPLVREGAVYGLERHKQIVSVAALLQYVSKMDVSPGVREAAAEALLEVE